MTLQKIYYKATCGESQRESTNRLKRADSHGRILLIHPDPEVRDKLTWGLQHSGFQVVATDDMDQAMAEALAKINGDEPNK